MIRASFAVSVITLCYALIAGLVVPHILRPLEASMLSFVLGAMYAPAIPRMYRDLRRELR
jgi:hypothetical protein